MMEISKQSTRIVLHHQINDECNHPRCCTTKEEMMVPEDLILEIVLRLPPVSVLRFKCVSKSWYSILSNHCFLRNHASHFHLSQQLLHHHLVVVPPPGLLLSPEDDFQTPSVYAILPQDEDEDEDEDEKPDPPSPNMLKVLLDHSLPAFKQTFPCCLLIDSCNGLLLYNIIHRPHEQYMVFNPITNQYKEVPLMDLLHTFIKPNGKKLKNMVSYDHPHIVFDPSKSSSYKLLTVLADNTTHSSTHFELYVYSSSDQDTASWRLLTSFTDKQYITRYIRRKTFMFDGVFYWLCNTDSIVCFDVVKECVWLLPLPPTPAEYPDRDVHYFGECGGRLRLIAEYCEHTRNYGRNFPCSFDIMEMEKGSTIWTVKSRVILEAGYDHLIPETPNALYQTVVKVMYLYETEKGEEAVLLNVDYKRIVSFNITTNTFGKELAIPYFEHHYCLNAFPFTPTLYPLLT